jgi:hypothetical protein
MYLLFGAAREPELELVSVTGDYEKDVRAVMSKTDDEDNEKQATDRSD